MNPEYEELVVSIIDIIESMEKHELRALGEHLGLSLEDYGIFEREEDES